MDEDWKNAFGILICAGICDGDVRGYAMACHRLALIKILALLSIINKAFSPKSIYFGFLGLNH